MDDLSSVRVDVDGSADNSSSNSSAPEPSGTASGQIFALVTGAVLIVGLVVAIAALRPSAGETADGAPRQATTTVPETPTNADSTTEADTRTFRNREVTSNGFSPQTNAIVRTDLGFLGVGRPDFLDGTPTLFRSLDGKEWTRVEATIDGTGPADQTVPWEYSNLIRTDDGFALLRSRPGGESFEASIVIERVVSDNGADWILDDDFRPLISTREDVPIPTFHTADGFGVTTVSNRTRPPLDAFLDQVINETAGVDPANTCFLEAIDEDSFNVFRCDGAPGPVLVRASDLVDPTLLDDVVTCAAAVRNFARNTTGLLTIHRADGSVSNQLDGAFSSLFTTLPDGVFASFYSGNNPFLGDPVARFSAAEDCEALPGALPDVEPPAIVLVSADNTLSEIPLPRSLQSLNPRRPALLGTEDGVLVALDEAVWRVDPETTIWTKIVDIPVTTDEEQFDFRFIDAERLFGTTDEMTVLIDLVSGEIVTTANDLRRFAEVAYVDDRTAIISNAMRNRIRAVVDLP